MNKKLIKIWSELNSHLFSFIRKKVRTREDAEDILQEVYIKLHNNIHTLKEEERIISWIYQITRNTINDCIKKCYRINLSELDDNIITMEEEEDNNLNEEIIESMKQFIEKLPPTSKEIIKLYEFENLSHKEIGEKMGIKENNSKVKLKRAREKLKKELDQCCVFSLDRYGNILNYIEK
ncbi:MAG: sigma-70 family RNA polymerase sigma factor [Fusobacteriaceae bacterium]